MSLRTVSLAWVLVHSLMLVVEAHESKLGEYISNQAAQLRDVSLVVQFLRTGEITVPPGLEDEAAGLVSEMVAIDREYLEADEWVQKNLPRQLAFHISRKLIVARYEQMQTRLPVCPIELKTLTVRRRLQVNFARTLANDPGLREALDIDEELLGQFVELVTKDENGKAAMLDDIHVNRVVRLPLFVFENGRPGREVMANCVDVRWFRLLPRDTQEELRDELGPPAPNRWLAHVIDQHSERDSNGRLPTERM